MKWHLGFQWMETHRVQGVGEGSKVVDFTISACGLFSRQKMPVAAK